MGSWSSPPDAGLAGRPNFGAREPVFAQLQIFAGSTDVEFIGERKRERQTSVGPFAIDAARVEHVVVPAHARCEPTGDRVDDAGAITLSARLRPDLRDGLHVRGAGEGDVGGVQVKPGHRVAQGAKCPSHGRAASGLDLAVVVPHLGDELARVGRDFARPGGPSQRGARDVSRGFGRVTKS